MDISRDELAAKILELLTEEPGQKAWDLAGRLGIDKKFVNSVLYKELKHAVRQDSGYRWYLRDTGEGRAEPASVGEKAAESRIGKIASYYLDVLGHDESVDATVFAVGKYGPDYLELPSFPPPPIDDLTQGQADDLRSQVSRIVYKKGTGSARKSPAIGYPVFARHVKSRRSNWEGFLLQPLFVFELDPDDPVSLRLVDADFPIINREPVGTLADVGGAGLMEEILALSADLGLSDPQTTPDLDELFLRLQQIRPNWTWVDELDPDDTTGDDPLAQVQEEGIYNRCILFSNERSQYTKGLEGELQEFRRMADSRIEGTALGRLVGLSAGNGSPGERRPLLEVIPLNTEQRHAVESAMERPLTVITGPPGTGKSQVVTEIVVNAIWQNQRVLVASKNNKAVDVVEYRVNSFANQPSLFRLGANQLNQRLADYLATVLSANIDEEDRRNLTALNEAYNEQLGKLREIDASRSKVVQTRNRVDELSRQTEDAREALGARIFARARNADLELVSSHLEAATEKTRRLDRSAQPFLSRLFWGMLREGRLREAEAAFNNLKPYFQFLTTDNDLPEPTEATAEVLRKRLKGLADLLEPLTTAKRYHDALSELAALPTLEELARKELRLQNELHGIAARLWAAWLQLLPERIDPHVRYTLKFPGFTV